MREHYFDSTDWETRRRRMFVRCAVLLLVAALVFFGIRGSYGLWGNPDGNRDCPSRSSWMAQPNFICQTPIVVPDPLTEPLDVYRSLHLDCGSAPPGDMALIYNLCCASVRVYFERTQNPYLQFENGTTIKFRNVDMASILVYSKSLVCADQPCTALCMWLLLLHPLESLVNYARF